MRTLALLCLLFSSLLPTLCGAQGLNERQWAPPRVVDKTGTLCLAEVNNCALDGEAKVWLVNGKDRTALAADSEKRGWTSREYYFPVLPIGDLSLRVEKPLFEPLDFKVRVLGDSLTLKAITLKPTKENVASGRVVDDKGAAVKNAEVRIDTEKVRTDDAGKFRLVGAFRTGNTLGAFVEVEGFELADATLSVTDKKPTDIRLKRATRIFGKVKGLTGAIAPVKASWGKDESTQVDGQLNEDGMYSVTIRRGTWKGAFNGGDVEITMTYAGLLTKGMAKNVKAGNWQTADLEFSAKGTGSVIGSIIGIDGKPLPGVSLEVEDEGYGRSVHVRADAKGVFRIPSMPSGKYRARLQEQENRGYAQQTKRTFTVAEGEETRFDYDYTGRMVIRCRFTEAAYYCGSIIVDAGSEWYSCRTDGRHEGWLELYGAASGNHQFRLQDRKGVVQNINIETSDKPVVIDRFLKRANISGKVIFPAGKEPRNPDRSKWRVALYERYFETKSATVNEDGSFEFSDVAPGDYSIDAQIDGFYSGWLHLKVEGPVQQYLELREACSVRVTMRFNGLPLESFQTDVLLSREGGAFRPLPRPNIAFGDNQPVLVCATLPPGKITVRINSQSFPSWKKESDAVPLMHLPETELELKAGETGEVVLQLEVGAALSIEGLPGGTGLKEIWLEDADGHKLVGADHGFTMGSGDHDASAWLESLKAGTYFVVVEKSGYKKYREKIELTAGKEATHKVKLERE
jgi:hypothetical protein